MGSGPLRAKARVEQELFEKLGYAEDASRGVLVLEDADAARPTTWRRGWRGKAGVAPDATDVRRRADRQPRRRRADRGARDRDRPAQDGDARLRREARRERDRHGAAAAGGEERPARDRPHQRLRAVRRAGALHRAAPTTTSWPSSPSACRRRRSPTTARRSTTSSSATTTTSTRSTRLLFSPAEVWLTSATSGRTFHAGRARTRACCARRSFEVRCPMQVVILSAATGWHTDELLPCAGRARARGRGAAVRGAGAHDSARPKASPAATCRAEATPILDADAVLARIIPSGSLEQIIYRVDALHWIEERGMPVINSPRAIERSVDKFYTTRCCRRRGCHAGNGRVRERGRRDGRGAARWATSSSSRSSARWGTAWCA